MSLDIQLYFQLLTNSDESQAKWQIMNRIPRNVEGCGCGVIWDTAPSFARRNWGKPQHTISSVTIGGFRVQIRVQDLLNSKQFSTRTNATFGKETTTLMIMMMILNQLTKKMTSWYGRSNRWAFELTRYSLQHHDHLHHHHHQHHHNHRFLFSRVCNAKGSWRNI
jgi:hypothetical protein